MTLGAMAFPQQFPLAKVGDIIQVHVPPIGTWRVDAVVLDVRGRHFYRISRKSAGHLEFRLIATAGIEVLTPGADKNEPSTRIDQSRDGLADGDRWAAINAGNEKALEARQRRGAPTQIEAK